MKPALLRPQERQDRRDNVRYDRQEAGATVAAHLVDRLQAPVLTLQRQPNIGSSILGKQREVISDSVQIVPIKTSGKPYTAKGSTRFS